MKLSHFRRYIPLNWRLRYKVMAFLARALFIMPAAMLAATDIFSDVPASNIFHDDINAIYGARITNGTSPGIYNPGLNVNREQMAAFLHRGLGRLAYAQGFSYPLSNSQKSIALLKIKTGGASGGKGFLKVDAALTSSYTRTTGCPCLVSFWLSASGGPQSHTHNLTIYNATNYLGTTASGAATLAFELPTGNLLQEVNLNTLAFSTDSSVSQNIFAYGEITAVWVPFGAAGGDTLDIP